MPEVTLSIGVRLLSQQVHRAEFYPSGSFRSSTIIHSISAGRYGALETHEQSFLCIHTTNGTVHVRGSGAARDAAALEEVGIRVYRSP
jgi:hypothetical protein